ncbi:MAG: carbohydrate-binding protein [Lachnospiraceae bacterium]|nr:carbohydrate-binding protein [Lachnospiraceae bacterium]
MKIEVFNDWQNTPKAFAEGEDSVLLSWDGEYRRGDTIKLSGILPDNFYMVKIDAVLEESLVYINRDTVIYTVPFFEKKTSMNPLAFFGNRHYISIRRAMDFEIKQYRNLAKNTFAQHEESGVYPYAYANVETRGEAVFAARNAIDGCLATKGHGEWPYASWGINRQDDAKLTIDFKTRVDIEEIRLYTRADFPHDNWWVQARISFSDNSEETLHMEKLVEKPHCFPIKKKSVSSVSLDRLIKADDPSPFPALTQIEIYGCYS